MILRISASIHLALTIHEVNCQGVGIIVSKLAPTSFTALRQDVLVDLKINQLIMSRKSAINTGIPTPIPNKT